MIANKRSLILKLGTALVVIGVLAYGALFLVHPALVTKPLVYLLLLLLVLLGYIGIVIFLTGLLFWSFTQSKKIKFVIWIFLLAVVGVIFMPLPLECRYQGDIGMCSGVFPHQFKYWHYLLVPQEFQKVSPDIDEVVVLQPFLDLIAQEGIGDVWEAVTDTVKKISND